MTVKVSSDALYGYYCEWLRQAEEAVASGDRDALVTSLGLCYSTVITDCFPDAKQHHDIREELSLQFQQADLDCITPFNATLVDLQMESRNRQSHLNERRLQWVRDRIKDYENAYFPNPR